LNETLLWLLYCVSGVIAFAAVYHRRWHIGLAILVGGLLTGVGWMLIYQLTDEEKRPNFLRLDLALNLTFGMIFAVLAALLAKRLVTRRGPFQ
jgi:hypothetical protein